MNSRNEGAEKVWEQMLPQIRMTRIRRRNRRIAAPVGAVAVLLVSWLAMRQPPDVHESVAVRTGVPEVEETIAVMRVDENGRMRLEELPASELGSVELQFSLTQLVSDDLPEW